MATILRIGINKTDITPLSPLPLAGFGHRRGPYEGIASNIYARTLVLETTDSNTNVRTQGIIVSADVIWWGMDSVIRLQEECTARWGISKERCLFHATHSHGGPQTASNMTPTVGEIDLVYIGWLEQQVLGGIQAAMQRMEQVTVEHGAAECGFAMHRRKRINGKIEMAPNPDETIDREVNVVRFVNASNRTKALLFHYACHPTTSDQQRLSSEFPGAASELLEHRLGDETPALFLQGFSGDVRPNLVKEEQFYRGTQADIERLGQELADVVSGVLCAPMRSMTPARLCGQICPVELPYQQVSNREQLERYALMDGIEGEWAALLMKQSDVQNRGAVAYFQYFSFAEQLGFLTANGEFVSGYGLWIKQRTQGRVLAVGYSNGMIGYVPTKRQLEEGGYEAAVSYRYFGLPGTFSYEIEQLLHDEWTTLLDL
ncbi:neutral/alkaline non-lysosomal ceramidase N-terminal domain-containing protein [Cohnella soli]|uniref:Neutral/alkaline non-lysosomal ceramidase N-terminal domain-containing protein n=1 Tax=Cohnella soli TaxID=425005 RepID=A0ABW0HR87_9BACL